MHKEILSELQTNALPIISLFKDNFGLVGGTAIALYLGHRESIDYDLFSNKSFDNSKIIRKLKANASLENTITDKLDELTVVVNKVKITFLYYPFPIEFKDSLEEVIKIPDLLTLAAMKAYALGRRSKWKDYVDLYFILKEYSLKDITSKAQEIFKDVFNERLFREQLRFFKGINYDEKIDYTCENKPTEEEIKSTLTQISSKSID